MIGKFLVETYARGVLLTGIILLHPVSGNRMQGSERRRLRLFEKICGPHAYSHVVIASTMWSEITDVQRANSGIQERKDDYWEDMLDEGAEIVMHDNTQRQALEIVRKLLGKGTVKLQMQDELDMHDGQLSATSAGKQLHSDLDDSGRKLLAELAKIRTEMIETHRAEKQALQGEIDELTESINYIWEQQEKLSKKRLVRTLQSLPIY